MENYINFKVEELQDSELKDFSGGWLGAIAGAIASVAFGYNLGKDLYHIIHD